MNELMIIVFGLATIRAIKPLAEPENWKFGKITVALTMCWAFWHLISNCATITFSGL